MTTTKFFWATWEINGEKFSSKVTAENRDAAESLVKRNVFNAENVYAYTFKGYLDEQIRKHINKLKISVEPGKENDVWASQRRTQVQERLRCCADAALMFGEDSQESLERTLGRAVDCDWEITGLDGHMFSFGFKSPAGFYGGIIFHCNSKDWSSHT